MNCIEEAVIANNAQRLSILLDAGEEDPNGLIEDEGPLHHSIFFGYEECVRLLLADPRTKIRPRVRIERSISSTPYLEVSPLTDACCAMNGNEDGKYTRIAKMILDQRELGRDNPEQNDDSAMVNVCRKGDMELFTLLLNDRRVNLVDMRWLFLHACERSRVEMMNELFMRQTTDEEEVLLFVREYLSKYFYSTQLEVFDKWSMSRPSLD